MVPLPCTDLNVRSVDMQFTQVAYGGCWKCPQDWQCCSASMPCLAASQNGLVHSFGTGIGRVTLLQSLIVMVCFLPISWAASLPRIGTSHALFPPARGCGPAVSGSVDLARSSAKRGMTLHAYRLARTGNAF